MEDFVRARNFFLDELVYKIFSYDFAGYFFGAICSAGNFFRPFGPCKKFIFKIFHPPPQKSNGRPLTQEVAYCTTIVSIFTS